LPIAIDQPEDGRVGADAERERQDRDGREQRVVAKAADGEAGIGQEVVEERRHETFDEAAARGVSPPRAIPR
jgi:hypothetical protein